MSRAATRLAGVLLLLGAGCVPSFDEVAPILEDKCLTCHQQGVASPNLEEPAAFEHLAGAIDEHLADHSMPPWPPSELSPAYRKSRAMDPHQRDLLRRWAAAGAPIDTDAELRAPIPSPLRSDSSWELPEYSPAMAGGEEYRCFEIDNPGASKLVGYQVSSDRPQLVHHVLVGVWPAAAGEQLRALDDADPGPGWDCPDAFMPDADPLPLRVPVLWFPGSNPTHFFPGSGSPLDRGERLVAQVHFFGDASPGPTKVQIDTAWDSDAAPETTLFLGSGDVDLPLDQSSVTLRRAGYVRTWLGAESAGNSVWVVGVRGHGHELLQELRIQLGDQILLDIDRWDPHWQSRYLLQEAIEARMNEVLSLECVYDNSPERRAAASYTKEMCGGWVFVTSEQP